MMSIFWTVLLIWVLIIALGPLIKLFEHWGKFLCSDEGKQYWRESADMTYKEAGEAFNRRLENWESGHEVEDEHKEAP